MARAVFERALTLARSAHLDSLAVDAIHMLAFVDTAPADQLKWAQQVLTVVEQSEQPAAKRWEASIRNNIGYALHQLGRYPEALTQFELALTLREQKNGANAAATRSARWMVAWTLRAGPQGRGPGGRALQLRLAREAEAAGQPDPFVFNLSSSVDRWRFGKHVDLARF